MIGNPDNQRPDKWSSTVIAVQTVIWADIPSIDPLFYTAAGYAAFQ
jgi:hypothetical protein